MGEVRQHSASRCLRRAGSLVLVVHVLRPRSTPTERVLLSLVLLHTFLKLLLRQNLPMYQ